MLPSSQFCLGDSFASTDLSFLIMLCLSDCWGPAAVVAVGLQSLPLVPEREEAERKAGNADTRHKRVRLRQAEGRSAVHEQEEQQPRWSSPCSSEQGPSGSTDGRVLGDCEGQDPASVQAAV